MVGRVECAWCGGTIRAGSCAASESSHGICFACVKEMGLFPTENVRELTQAQLDALPLGVVELDRECIVRRYNATEAAAAHLDAARVIGRHFFDSVAPCTSVREFRGRAEHMMRATQPMRDELDFVFAFASGDRFVHIVMTWDPTAERLLLLVDLMGDPADHARRSQEVWRHERVER